MKIVYSRFFVEDLEKMIGYISNELLNPVAADNLKSVVFKEIERLKESPLLGESLSSSLFINDLNLRSIIHKRIVIVYRVSDVITIERVFNARQDWLCLVGEMTDNQKR